MGPAPSRPDGRIYISAHTYMCISVTKAQRTKATSPEARKPDRGGCSVVTLISKPWWAVVQLELAPALTPCSARHGSCQQRSPGTCPWGSPSRSGFTKRDPVIRAGAFQRRARCARYGKRWLRSLMQSRFAALGASATARGCPDTRTPAGRLWRHRRVSR